MASWHGRPGHDTKLDRFLEFCVHQVDLGRMFYPRSSGAGRCFEPSDPPSQSLRRATPKNSVSLLSQMRSLSMLPSSTAASPSRHPIDQGEPAERYGVSNVFKANFIVLVQILSKKPSCQSDVVRL